MENIIYGYLHYTAENEITVSTYSNINSLLEHLDFDILFLDIVFDKKTDGLKAIMQMRKRGVNAFVVFISSLQSFKVSKVGFDCDVYNYIVKPYKADEICLILSQILKELQKRNTLNYRILLKNENGVNVVKCADITYIDIFDRKRQIHRIDSIVITNRTLKSLYEELPKDQFTYTHNAFIVNLDKVDTFNAQNVILKDRSEIPLSRSYKATFCDAINSYTCKGITAHV